MLIMQHPNLLSEPTMSATNSQRSFSVINVPLASTLPSVVHRTMSSHNFPISNKCLEPNEPVRLYTTFPGLVSPQMNQLLQHRASKFTNSTSPTLFGVAKSANFTPTPAKVCWHGKGSDYNSYSSSNPNLSFVKSKDAPFVDDVIKSNLLPCQNLSPLPSNARINGLPVSDLTNYFINNPMPIKARFKGPLNASSWTRRCSAPATNLDGILPHVRLEVIKSKKFAAVSTDSQTKIDATLENCSAQPLVDNDARTIQKYLEFSHHLVSNDFHLLPLASDIFDVQNNLSVQKFMDSMKLKYTNMILKSYNDDDDDGGTKRPKEHILDLIKFLSHSDTLTLYDKCTRNQNLSESQSVLKPNQHKRDELSKNSEKSMVTVLYGNSVRRSKNSRVYMARKKKLLDKITRNIIAKDRQTNFIDASFPGVVDDTVDKVQIPNNSNNEADLIQSPRKLIICDTSGENDRTLEYFVDVKPKSFQQFSNDDDDLGEDEQEEVALNNENRRCVMPQQSKSIVDYESSHTHYRCNLSAVGNDKVPCKFTTRNRKRWADHTDHHKGFKSHKCEQCAYTTTWYENLNQHFKRMHPGSCSKSGNRKKFTKSSYKAGHFGIANTTSCWNKRKSRPIKFLGHRATNLVYNSTKQEIDKNLTEAPCAVITTLAQEHELSESCSNSCSKIVQNTDQTISSLCDDFNSYPTPPGDLLEQEDASDDRNSGGILMNDEEMTARRWEKNYNSSLLTTNTQDLDSLFPEQGPFRDAAAYSAYMRNLYAKAFSAVPGLASGAGFGIHPAYCYPFNKDDDYCVKLHQDLSSIASYQQQQQQQQQQLWLNSLTANTLNVNNNNPYCPLLARNPKEYEILSSLLKLPSSHKNYDLVDALPTPKTPVNEPINAVVSSNKADTTIKGSEHDKHSGTRKFFCDQEPSQQSLEVDGQTGNQIETGSAVMSFEEYMKWIFEVNKNNHNNGNAPFNYNYFAAYPPYKTYRGWEVDYENIQKSEYDSRHHTVDNKALMTRHHQLDINGTVSHQSTEAEMSEGGVVGKVEQDLITATTKFMDLGKTVRQNVTVGQFHDNGGTKKLYLKNLRAMFENKSSNNHLEFERGREAPLAYKRTAKGNRKRGTATTISTSSEPMRVKGSSVPKTRKINYIKKHSKMIQEQRRRTSLTNSELSNDGSNLFFTSLALGLGQKTSNTDSTPISSLAHQDYDSTQLVKEEFHVNSSPHNHPIPNTLTPHDNTDRPIIVENFANALSPKDDRNTYGTVFDNYNSENCDTEQSQNLFCEAAEKFYRQIMNANNAAASNGNFNLASRLTTPADALTFIASQEHARILEMEKKSEEMYKFNPAKFNFEKTQLRDEIVGERLLPLDLTKTNTQDISTPNESASFMTFDSSTNHPYTNGSLIPHDQLLTVGGKRQRTHRCSLPGCNFEAYDKNRMLDHLAAHRGEKPHGCPYCEFRTSWRFNIKNHIRSKHPNML